MATPPLEVRPLKIPSRADWERERPLIKQLYVDQGLKLESVIDIMLHHGHKTRYVLHNRGASHYD